LSRYPQTASAEITLRGLITARWVVLCLGGIAAALMIAAPRSVVPLLNAAPSRSSHIAFVAVLAIWAALNVATQRYVVRPGRATQTIAGVHLLVDVAAITTLLGLTGGATNPFTTLLFVPITLATQVSPRWTWWLAGVALAGFAALFAPGPLPAGPPGHEHHFAGHLRGMWLAFGVSGLLITAFVHRIAVRIAKQRAELARLREEALEDRHLASLGSLAAGAAHELGTPLATIGVLIGDFTRMSSEERDEAIDAVRREVARCKAIVQRMATADARVTRMGASEATWPVAELATGLGDRDVPVRIRIDRAAQTATSDQPRESLAQVVRELVSNATVACKAKPHARGVDVFVELAGDRVRVRVCDDGVGMTAELVTTAFDPFVSTKPEGEGLGMGLYLSRAQLRQLGGSIELQSQAGIGTTVTITFPLRRPGDP
jgi:two-component system sensor histidine kinase RegB